MAAGAIVGGYAGAGTARRVGQKMVRRTVILIGFSLSAWLLLRQMGSDFALFILQRRIDSGRHT